MERPGDFDHQAAHADDPAIDLDAVEFVDLFGERFHRRPPPRRRCGRKRMVT